MGLTAGLARLRRGPGRPLLALACVLVGFLVVLTVRGRPAAPLGRLPEQFVLAGLINRQQETAADLRNQVDQLRGQISTIQAAQARRQTSLAGQQQQLSTAGLRAGLVPLRGPGLTVVLDDSTRTTSPTGNVDDLVIHSQDIQAVVNALWLAGAEGMAVNDERLVSTSAVLCVGNTLLLNGTVHSPPYRVVAIGASRDRFEADTLVKALHSDATTFGLRFSVNGDSNVLVPAYHGVTGLRYARPVS